LAQDFRRSAQDWIHINIGSQELSANHNILQIGDVWLLEEIGVE